MPIASDSKDWTWVLQQPCPQCGYDAADYRTNEFGEVIRANAQIWLRELTRGDVRQRPDDETWSVLEYACHVRDVLRIFRGRFELMLHEAEPTFPNWDQDQTAIDDHYDQQDPSVIAGQLNEAAEQLAEVLANVQVTEWGRTGRRSNGSVFSVASLGLYLLHDLIHHVWDVEQPRR